MRKVQLPGASSVTVTKKRLSGARWSSEPLWPRHLGIRFTSVWWKTFRADPAGRCLGPLRGYRRRKPAHARKLCQRLSARWAGRGEGRFVRLFVSEKHKQGGQLGAGQRGHGGGHTAFPVRALQGGVTHPTLSWKRSWKKKTPARWPGFPIRNLKGQWTLMIWHHSR